MKKYLLMILISFSSLLAGIAQAMTAPPPIPQICPSSTAISSVGVSRTVIQASNNGVWIAGRRSQKYNTTDNWTFLLTDIVATNVSDAYNKAVIGLNTLSFQLGPFSSQEHWLCVYNTVEGYLGITITPPIASFDLGKRFIN